jgi:hypothetical protein
LIDAGPANFALFRLKDKGAYPSLQPVRLEKEFAVIYRSIGGSVQPVLGSQGKIWRLPKQKVELA